MQELMDDSLVGELFGPELDEALSDARQAKRESQLDALANAGDEERSQAAEEARKLLGDNQPQFVKDLDERLKLYRQGKPYHGDP